MMNQQQQPTPYERFQENVGIVQAFLNVFSIPLVLIFRYHLGKKVIGNLFKGFGMFILFTGGFGIIFLLFLMQGFTSQGNPAFLILFLIGTIFLMLWHRAAMLVRRTPVHSYSLGNSWLKKIIPFLPYTFLQTILEPVLAAAIGLLINLFNPPLGIFIIISAVSLCVVQMIANQNDKRELEQLEDEQIRAKELEHHVNPPPEAQQPPSRVRVHQPNNQSASRQ